MLSVKIELVEALRQALETMFPGAGAKAAFEWPLGTAAGKLRRCGRITPENMTRKH